LFAAAVLVAPLLVVALAALELVELPELPHAASNVTAPIDNPAVTHLRKLFIDSPRLTRWLQSFARP
jgi:hypothetical protein